MNTTKKRGGPQPGSGRPPKDAADKAIKCNITMTPAHHAATKGDRAGMIRRALEFEAKYKNIVEAVIRAAFNNGLSIDPVGGFDLAEWEISLRTSNGGLVSMLIDWANGERKKNNQPVGKAPTP